MGILNELLKRKLYSDRRKEIEEGGKKDYYIYDEVPAEFRNKLVYLVGDTLKPWVEELRDSWYRRMVSPTDTKPFRITRDAILRKYGYGHLPGDTLEGYIHQADSDHLLDFIELFLVASVQSIDGTRSTARKKDEAIKSAMERLDAILKEHRIGYEFVGGQMIRKDSEYLHREIIKEAINLMYVEGFDGALTEFMRAIELSQEEKKESWADAITNANKAFESTMKAICDKHGISYHKHKDTAKDLIQKMYDSGFLMPYLQNFTDQLRIMMASGLPTIRSREGAHGHGLKPKDIQRSYVQFALHLAGTFIVFLIQRHEEKSKP